MRAFKLSIGFLKLVGIAILVAIPLSWLVMNSWLQEFSFRVDIGPLTLVLASMIAALISLATVSYQSIRAALANPVDSLRAE